MTLGSKRSSLLKRSIKINATKRKIFDIPAIEINQVPSALKYSWDTLEVLINLEKAYNAILVTAIIAKPAKKNDSLEI